MKLSDYVCETIRDAGVGHLFLVPGGGAMHLNDSAGHTAGLACVYNLHEQGSAIAAEAYARASGGLGAAMVTSGPGSTNAVTGALAAWLDSTPVLFVSGQVKTADLRPDPRLRQVGVQEVDICSIVRPITKYAVTVTDPTTIRRHLETALHLSRSGRPGPVWIDLPLDVQAARIEPGGQPGAGDEWDRLEPARASVLPADRLADRAREIAGLLGKTQRPVLLAGDGIHVAGAAAPFERLVRAAGVPVLTTRLAVDLMPADDPLAFGMPGMLAARSANFVLQNADLLLAIGARIDQNLVAYDPARFARGATKVVVNVDGAELERLAAVVDLPVCADAAEFIAALLDELPGGGGAPTEWLERCRQWRASYPFVSDDSVRDARAAGSLSVYEFSQMLSHELAADDVILPGSSGAACEVFLTALAVKRGQRVFHNKGTGAMGLGQPAALGACLGAGGRRVVCVDGDGGFQFNAQELETIRRLDLPVKIFVVSNAGYACIRQSQEHHFRRLSGADGSSGLTLPDVCGLATAYGVRATRIDRPEGLRHGIREVLASAGPAVCEVVTAPDEERLPRVQSLVRPDGSVVSKPLEDMWPYLERDEFRRAMIVPPVVE